MSIKIHCLVYICGECMSTTVALSVLGFISTDQLLRTVLSLYMPSEDLPLPTFEEVLFCDGKTTSEEVGCMGTLWKLNW